MSEVVLNNISIRFRKYHGYANGLKEAVMRWVSTPGWYKDRPPSKTEFWGLWDINLELRKGDRLGIVGHNGAGKSTLLKIMSRIYRPTRGTMSVKGRLVPLIEIGAGFNPELSGRENAYLNAAILGIPRKLITDRMDSIVEFSELEEYFDMPVKYYSTGMNLRLAFSIATEISPDILILDELFAGGDKDFIKKANTRLEHFIEQSHIFILVSHDLDYVRRFCNRAIILDHGKLVAEGHPDEIVDRYLTDAYLPLSQKKEGDTHPTT